MIPDFFSDEYHQKARDALKRVDGMSLANLLVGRVFNVLFREVFSKDLGPRSREMVDIVKAFMEKVLTTLFEEACEQYPGLLGEIKGTLVEEFMEHNREQTLKAVSNVVNAELGWVFTQDRAYDKAISDVRDSVTMVRAQQVSSKAAEEAGTNVDPSHRAEAVGDVPKEFIEKMVANTDAKDEDTRELQVTIHSYTDVVCRRLSDVVPKQVHHFLVDSICRGLVPWMVKRVTAEDLEAWFTEDAKTQRKRKDTLRKLAQFKQGMKLLERARSTIE